MFLWTDYEKNLYQMLFVTKTQRKPIMREHLVWASSKKQNVKFWTK